MSGCVIIELSLTIIAPRNGLCVRCGARASGGGLMASSLKGQGWQGDLLTASQAIMTNCQKRLGDLTRGFARKPSWGVLTAFLFLRMVEAENQSRVKLSTS